MTYRTASVLVCAVAAAALVSCSRKEAEKPPAGTAPAAGASADSGAAASGEQPAVPAAIQPTRTGAPMPPGGVAATPGATPTATGKVIETMDAAGYTYVRLDTGSEKIWAATAPLKVKVGQELTVPLEMPMQNFHSSALDRDFPLIYFASRVARGGESLPPRPAMPTAEQRAAAGPAPGGQPMPASTGAPAAQAPGQVMPPGHPPLGTGATPSPIKVTEVIAPPSGGLSVADVWAKRASLAGKPVVVRGKVTKFLAGIMGKNWVHLQDGTGKAADGTNDITVTTDADAKAGDIITASGTLAVDKDFGAGYKYGAIVEGATLSK